MRWALNPMTEVFMKERRQRRGRRPWQLRQGLEGCGYDPRKAKVSGIHQKLGRGKEKFFLGAFRGSIALIAPLVWTSSLQNFEKINFCCFRPPS